VTTGIAYRSATTLTVPRVLPTWWVPGEAEAAVGRDCLWGTLRGKENVLAAEGQEYPIMAWQSKPSPKANATGPDPEITFEETITAMLGAGMVLST
jgi:hypothetical protein